MNKPNPSATGMREHVDEVREASQRALRDVTRLRREAHEMRVQVQLMRLAEQLPREPADMLVANLTLLNGLAEMGAAVSDLGMADVQLREPQSGALRLAVQRNFTSELGAYRTEHAYDPLIATHGGALPRHVVVEDIATELVQLPTSALEIMLQAGIRAANSVPLVSARAGWMGWLSVYHSQPGESAVVAMGWLAALERQLPDFLARHSGLEAGPSARAE